MINQDSNSGRQFGQNVRRDDSAGPVFSPRMVAKAIGVSESSLKRWCDAGLIAATKTAGGHRRVNRGSVIEFLKQKELELHDPTIIGLPSFEAIQVNDSADALQQFVAILLEGNESKCKELLMYLYINRSTMAEIFDTVVAPAFEQIGEMWRQGRLEIFVERRACEICMNSMRELRSCLSPPAADAFTAMGGTIANDHYLLPTLAVEMTLSSQGWQANSLGSNLPFETMLKAVESQRPDLFWISVSHVVDANSLVGEFNQFAASIPPETTLIVGGSALSDSFRAQIRNAVCCSNLSQLVASVRNFKRKPGSGAGVGKSPLEFGGNATIGDTGLNVHGQRPIDDPNDPLSPNAPAQGYNHRDQVN